jgi:hypothetical protein
MTIQSDRWIREQALAHKMIEPFVEAQRADGCLKSGPLKDLVVSLSKAFGDWVHLIHQARKLLADQ